MIAVCQGALYVASVLCNAVNMPAHAVLSRYGWHYWWTRSDKNHASVPEGMTQLDCVYCARLKYVDRRHWLRKTGWGRGPIYDR